MPIGHPMLQTLIGECMQVPKLITMIIHGVGDLLGVGTEAIAHIGALTAAGAGVEACPGVGADHSVGAGEALSDGEVHTGATDILLTGVVTMIHSGADIMVTHGVTEEVIIEFI